MVLYIRSCVAVDRRSNDAAVCKQHALAGVRGRVLSNLFRNVIKENIGRKDCFSAVFKVDTPDSAHNDVHRVKIDVRFYEDNRASVFTRKVPASRSGIIVFRRNPVFAVNKLFVVKSQINVIDHVRESNHAGLKRIMDLIIICIIMDLKHAAECIVKLNDLTHGAADIIGIGL